MAHSDKASPRSTSGLHDFDFLIGNWSVLNKRLKSRLSGSDEWTEFPATLEVRQILEGLGNIDQFKTAFGEETFEGVSLRLYNPKEETWRIYWMDTGNPVLTEQVTGSFKEGVGEFFGEELFGGRTVKLRFLWSSPSISEARWEQAYYDNSAETWETNWIMEFSRLD